jgi:polyhydroxybutyrate depolymerase
MIVWLLLALLIQDVDFADRTYELYVPESYAEGQPAPLLLVLHGAGGTGARTRGWLGLDELADENGFIVAYPDGLANNWDFGNGLPTRSGNPFRVDDVGFLVWLVDEIGKSYRIDRERVFAAGMSNGALMTYRLACEAPETFAAIAAVAAPVYVPAVRGCEDTPVSVLHIHGTEDPILPWDRVLTRGGQVLGLSAFDTFAFWSQHNGCSQDQADIQAEELPDSDPDDGSTVRHLALDDCAEGTEVHFYGIEGGGHTWPGHPFNVDLELGNLNMDMDASEVIMHWLTHLPVRRSSSEATPESGDL